MRTFRPPFQAPHFRPPHFAPPPPPYSTIPESHFTTSFAILHTTPFVYICKMSVLQFHQKIGLKCPPVLESQNPRKGGLKLGGLKFCAITTQFQAPPKVVKEHSTWANFPPDNSRGGLNVGGQRKPTRKQLKNLAI
jgi:hypothetical protein